MSVASPPRSTAETTGGPVGLSFHEFLLAGKRGKESTDDPRGQHTQSAAGVLRDAERLGNVSEACRRHGLSRTVFYRLRQRLEQYGPDGVHPKRRQARRGRPPAVPVQTERRVIAFALAWPTCGPQWYSDQLAREGVPIAPVTIWRLLRRQQLGTAARDWPCWSGAAPRRPGCLTERTAKPVRHVEAAQPGDCCRSTRSMSAS